MIEKTENPLGLQMEYIQALIYDLQPSMDAFQNSPVVGLSLSESNITTTIENRITGQEATYSLEQLKKLKAELLDPVINAVKEFA